MLKLLRSQVLFVFGFANILDDLLPVEFEDQASRTELCDLVMFANLNGFSLLNISCIYEGLSLLILLGPPHVRK